jgi:predicted amidophosphoribosyltransferase
VDTAIQWRNGGLSELVSTVSPWGLSDRARPAHTSDMLTDLADLILARSCLGCDRSGRIVCGACWESLRGQAQWVNMGAIPLSVGTTYDGLGRTLVLAHKRSLLRSLSSYLGELLAEAIGMHTAVHRSSQVIYLVTIPPHARAKRDRGQDTVLALAHAAARIAEARFHPITALRFRDDAGSLAGLNRRERQVRMADAFVARPGHGAPCVIVDDVVTTGSTFHSAAKTLEMNSWRVLGCSASAGVR